MLDIIQLSKLQNKNFSKATNELYQLTDFNKNQYPNYYKWFYSKNIPRILNGSGEILFTLDCFMIKGIAILKKTEEEKKICTLLVDDPYRNQKLGSKLIEESFRYLETDKPVITIPEKNISQFQHFINIYNWKDTEIINDYFSKEIKFN